MGLLFRDRLEDRTGYGYTTIDNRILSDNYTDLSVDAYMILTRCLSHSSGWQLNWTQFEKKYKITIKRRIRAINELTEKGHFIEDKWRVGRSWYYNYIFFEIAQTKDEIKYFKENFLPKLRMYDCTSTIMDVKFNMHTCTCTNHTDNNNKEYNNKDNNKKEINNNDDNNENQKSRVNNFSLNNSNIHDTCLHVSNTTNIFSENKINNEKNIEGDLTNLNNSPKIAHKQFKGKKADGTTTKNKAEYLAEQGEQPVQDVLANTNAKPLSEQTAEEKAENNIRKMTNDTLAKIKEADQRLAYKQQQIKNRENLRIQISKCIDEEYQNEEIALLFKEYISCLTDKGITVTPAQYRLLKRDLENFSLTDEGKKAILEIAISYGVPKLKKTFNSVDFEENRLNPNKGKVTNPIPKPAPQKTLPSKAYELARDEHGNLITF